MRVLAFVLSCLALPLSAHELWIEPHAFEVEPDGNLIADVVNGEDFVGAKLAYIPQRFAHFLVFRNGQPTPVTGRVGDQPAMDMAAIGDGLNVVVYQARNSTVNYANWEKFQRFVDHKDFGDVLSQHQARGLPEGDFDEVYSRYSKSLIGVGEAAGSDLRTGLTTELVALNNPYTDDVSGGMRVQLFYNNDVRANTQVEVFEKSPTGAVAQAFYRTDGQGIATIPVKPGHIYMADAVVLREPTAQLAQDTGAVWETLWANLTWAVPG